MQNAGNCRATSSPSQARYTRRIVVPGSRQQAGQTLCIVIEPSDQNGQRWIFYVKEVERIDNPRRASLEPSVVPGPPTGETEIPHSDPEGEDHSSARDVKRARGEPEQDLSGEMLVPGADETLTPAEIPAVPFGAIPSSSTSIPISPGASSSSGVKRAYSESTALPSSPGVSSGSGVKRAHGDSIEEQPGTRTRISALIAGPHGTTTKFAAVMRSQMNGCPHCTLRLILSPKMVIEAKRKEMERIQQDEGVSCCHKGVHGKGRRGEDDQHITNKGTEEHPIAKARLVAREFNTGDKRGESFAGTPGLMAIRTMISRATTKCENGARRPIMLADVRTAFLFGDAVSTTEVR